jgi:23S rRNA pseudouridine2605 synthase
VPHRPREGPRDREPLERLLSKWRVASRSQARDLVLAGRVQVNGRVTRDPRRVLDPRRDAVALDGVAVGPRPAPTTWLALNKPRGVVVTTRDPEGRRTVMDLLGPSPPPGLAPVGRLDQASAGLLLLTDDHALAARLLDPRSKVSKRYRVKVRGRLTDEHLARLSKDSLVEDGLVLGPMEVEVESRGPRSSWLLVSLREGRNRQIRRRLEALGLAVEHLIRLSFGPILLGSLPPGSLRPLTPSELSLLRRAASPTR